MLNIITINNILPTLATNKKTYPMETIDGLRKIDKKMVECPKCNGTGQTPHHHIENGKCFRCDGGGFVTAYSVKMSDKRLADKKEREAKERKEREERIANKIQSQHDEARSNFNKLVDECEYNLHLNPDFAFCEKLFNHKHKEFNKEIFEDMLQTWWEQHCHYRLALCKYFREKGVYDSKFEYKQDDYDRNEFMYK